ncbi:hypothetical protein CKK33_05690 [Mucilaginibacter sp. MD40]|nr:hypothetical protein CKK33_05690 [Mucilaginibacter sp. MD40]
MKVESNALTDMALLSLTIIIVWWMSNELNRRGVLNTIIFSIAFYVCQRFNPYWHFTKSYLFQIAYWDVVCISSFGTLLLNHLFNKEIKDQTSLLVNEGFSEDLIVDNLDKDSFNRKQTAKTIADLIMKTKNSMSFAIGIIGEYGSGKTSFLELISIYLNKEEKVLKIPFNPWNANSPESIRNYFFDVLSQNIADTSQKTSSLIYNYGRRLANVDSRLLLSMNWFNFFKNQGTIQSPDEYKMINHVLGSLGKKIIITIDDLDRLYPDEIMEVLKLIRNTANFSNVFYLVGYDRDYVQDATKSLSNKVRPDYLDKIFQLEIPLPKRQNDDLLKQLQEYLNKFITEKHRQVFEGEIVPKGFSDFYGKGYGKVLRQSRDVIRFVNSFKVIYQLIGEEVDFECLMILELIKFRFSSVYDLIHSEYRLFLIEKSLYFSHSQYFSPLMIRISGKNEPYKEVSKFKLHIEKLGWINDRDLSILDNLFLSLFDASDSSLPKAQNSISYPMYFDIYFRFSLSNRDLSDKAYRTALSSGKMSSFMIECANQGLHKELMTRLMQEGYGTKNDFEKVIRLIFSYGRTFVYKEGLFRFDYRSLINKLSNYHNGITDRLYRKQIDPYLSFLRSRFVEAVAPFLFENELIFHLKQDEDNLLLPIEDLNSYQLSYFNRMISSDHGLSENTLWLFWAARMENKEDLEKNISSSEAWRFVPELVSVIKPYLTKLDICEFLKFSIQTDIRNKSIAKIARQVLEMFEDPLDYRKIVNENPILDDLVRSEYIELFDKLHAVNFNQYVEIEFKSDLANIDRKAGKLE